MKLTKEEKAQLRDRAERKKKCRWLMQHHTGTFEPMEGRPIKECGYTFVSPPGDDGLRLCLGNPMDNDTAAKKLFKDR